MLIGVPVAATPGLVPHDEVETVLAGAELDDAGDEAAALDAGALAAELELLEELELQPARTPSATAARTAAAVEGSIHVFCLLLTIRKSHCLPNGRVSPHFQGMCSAQGGRQKKPPLTSQQVNGASLHCFALFALRFEMCHRVQLLSSGYSGIMDHGAGTRGWVAENGFITFPATTSRLP
jgi:hypothetical protein